MTNPVILSVLAHPDDESFGMGGTLALYAEKGCDVYLVCATRGEVGMVDPEHMEGFSSIAELREGELRCAAQHLGLKNVFFLGYRDSGMQGSPDNSHPDAQVAHPVEEVAAKVVKYIRELKPDVVLTFDPIGGYRHPDHIHIHLATVLAFERSNDGSYHPEAGAPFQPGRLYFHTIPRGFLKFGVRLIRLFGGDPGKWGRNKDIDLASFASVDFPTHVRINYQSVAHKKTAASICHASQGGGQMRRGWVGLIFRMIGEVDSYMQAYPPAQPGGRVKNDLLA
jgi:LmbE family N-acetylglucosaminyl deacetylase